MKNMKKLSLIVAIMMVVAMFTGCAQSFDASNYLKAILDNSYKNDSTGIVDQKISTAEEAEEVYNQGIETELSSITAGVNLSDEVQASFKDTFQELFKAADYTVGEAEKQDDGSYIVNVEYKQLQVFKTAYEAYTAKAGEIDATQYESQEDLYNDLYLMLSECIMDALANPTYADAATTTVKVAATNNVYTPDTTDLTTLETLLFDIDAIQ